MGIFDFDKKESQEPVLKSPADFYSDCVADFHEEARDFGVARKGLIFIPELIPLGEKAILAYLKEPRYQSYCGGDVHQYYYMIMALSIDSGICFATKWNEEFSTLNQYADEIIQSGPAAVAAVLKVSYFPDGTMDDNGNFIYSIIFDRWVELLEPYWELSDPRDYIFKALLAAYQLGVSLILEKNGY